MFPMTQFRIHRAGAGRVRRAWSPALAALALALFARADVAWAQSGPTVDRCWTSNVGPTYAMLNCAFQPYGAPSHTWFEFGTAPDLSSAGRFGEERNPGYESGVQTHARVNLRPNATYYYRLHVQTPFGRAVGPVMSFKAVGPAVTHPARVTFNSKEFRTWNGYSGWMLHFLVESEDLPGRMWAIWSTDPGMKGARVVLDPQWGGGVRGFDAGGASTHVLVPANALPDNTTIYVQGVVETSPGQVKSGVVSFVNKRPSSNY